MQQATVIAIDIAEDGSAGVLAAKGDSLSEALEAIAGQAEKKLEELEKKLNDMKLGKTEPVEKDDPYHHGLFANCTWEEAIQAIERLRDKASIYYGFSDNLIYPVRIADPEDPLKDSVFDVLGVRYKVHDAELTCLGEVEP